MTLSTLLRVLERDRLPWELTRRGEIRCPVRWGDDWDQLNPLTWVALRCLGRYVPMAQSAYLREMLGMDPKLLQRLWGAVENKPGFAGLRKEILKACGLEGL